MNKTKIETFDRTWNPISGCLRGCNYCYARKITHRFCTQVWGADGGLHILNEPQYFDNSPGGDFDKTQYIKDPYPYEFDPTFHRYRLDEPTKLKTPSNIFVCSMADLFGEWIPDEWIQEIFKACEAAPQHRYLFLTKNPKRYCEITEYINNSFMSQYSPEVWFGVTITGKLPNIFNNSTESRIKSFLSIEPYLENIEWIDLTGISWVIIGAETGNHKNKVVPHIEWIENIIAYCRVANVPVFMKNSLIPIMGEKNMLREFPWEVR